MVKENQNVDDISRFINDALQDNKLSFKAKGVISFLVSNFILHEVTIELLLKSTQKDTTRSIQMAIKELEEHKYLVRVKEISGDNRWILNIQTKEHEPLKKTRSKKNQNEVNTQATKKKKRQRRKKKGIGHSIMDFLKEFI